MRMIDIFFVYSRYVQTVVLLFNKVENIYNVEVEMEVKNLKDFKIVTDALKL